MKSSKTMSLRRIEERNPPCGCLIKLLLKFDADMNPMMRKFMGD